MVFSDLAQFVTQIIYSPKMKRKLFLLVLLSAIIGLNACDKVQSDVVDNHFANYTVQYISAPSSYAYSDTDSVITFAVQIANFKNINKVWLTIKTGDGSQYLVKDFQLFDDGYTFHGDTKASDGIFSVKFPMSKKYSNGNYIVEFFAEDNLALGAQSIAKIGEQLMSYDNKQTNYPPVISNVTLPSTVNRGDSFVMSVKVDDANGLGDISMTFFKLYRPDGTIVMSSTTQDYFIMFDNGDLSGSGDVLPSDGIYSLKNSFSSTTVTGNWRFDFQSKDKSGVLSNLISKTIEVK